MTKAIFPFDEKKVVSHEVALSRAKKALGDGCACCILISCSKPAEDGKMEVAMHFEGDETLAAFLIESASEAFDDKTPRRELS